MNPHVYNASVGAGVALVAIGAGAEWGWPIGMIAAGALVLGMTLLTLRMVAGAR